MKKYIKKFGNSYPLRLDVVVEESIKHWAGLCKSNKAKALRSLLIDPRFAEAITEFGHITGRGGENSLRQKRW